MKHWLTKIPNNGDVSNILNNMREHFWLKPKKHESNFIFESKVVENAHIMKRGMDDICRELFVIIEEPLRLKKESCL
jgi:hypothetical protein